jgi:hypothetical protein
MSELFWQVAAIALCTTALISLWEIPTQLINWIFLRVGRSVDPLNREPIKPFECALCMTTWLAIIYTLLTVPLVQLRPSHFLTCLFWAYMTEIIYRFLLFLQDAVCGLMEKLTDKIRDDKSENY